MKTTRGTAVLVVAVLASLAACTGGASGGGTTEPSPSPASATVSVSPNPAIYLYENAGLTATVDLEAHTLVIQNATGQAIGKPAIYVLAADDAHRVDGKVLDAAPVSDEQTATFDISLTGIEPSNIGLMLLVVGGDNDGAFVQQ